jgi:hypothetical protein
MGLRRTRHTPTTHTPWTRWWTRAVAIACTLLTLEVAAPARADCTAAPAVSATTLPLPPPGTCRLILIGPEMVLEQDETGRLTPADEPPPKRSRRRNAAAIMLGLLTAGAVFTLGRDDLTNGRAAVR